MLTQRWTMTGIAAGTAVLAAAAAMYINAPTRNITLPEVSAFSAEPEASEQTATVPVNADYTPAEPATTYLLSLRGDVLSVYASGQKEPIERYTVPAGLPDYDRILLEYGMEVPTEAELRQIMEDYLS